MGASIDEARKTKDEIQMTKEKQSSKIKKSVVGELLIFVF